MGFSLLIKTGIGFGMTMKIIAGAAGGLAILSGIIAWRIVANTFFDGNLGRLNEARIAGIRKNRKQIDQDIDLILQLLINKLIKRLFL
jgi:hypothetical protein